MEEHNDQKTKSLFDDAFLEQIRRQMLKFATLQLSDAHLAEDVVQEALVGALKNARSFGGRAALKSWVFAILFVGKKSVVMLFTHDCQYSNSVREAYSSRFDSTYFRRRYIATRFKRNGICYGWSHFHAIY